MDDFEFSLGRQVQVSTYFHLVDFDNKILVCHPNSFIFYISASSVLICPNVLIENLETKIKLQLHNIHNDETTTHSHNVR